MTIKKKTKAEKKKSPTKQKKANIVLFDNPEIKRIYSNYIAVTTTPHECSLTFYLIDPLDTTSSEIKAKVVGKIMIPNNLVEETVDIISKNFKKTMKKLQEIKPKK